MKDFAIPAQIKLTRWTQQQQHAQELSLQSENKHHRHTAGFIAKHFQEMYCIYQIITQ